MRMVLAYHVIFRAYGFWLPNDPRGSWSSFVASWELLRFGKATHAHTRTSLAAAPHDHAARCAAKHALHYPPVTFNGNQANAVAHGFAQALRESAYVLYACSILAEHVHLVVGRNDRNIKRIVGHFKGRATHTLAQQNMHPLVSFPQEDRAIPSPWGENCWKVFLDTPERVLASIQYVEQNPIKEGHRAQAWPFLAPYNERTPLRGIQEHLIFRPAAI